ncbi:MAG: hypothetical protein UX80_C0004G0006 [Candidatus Amesbacteria bacterium GW2011_GWA2_47_11b]|uniref:Uncharacterized protein n=2 Tax=Candidatus Amesiibacteriota TaxID=1752730 RepID=A0A0G1UKJ5_9BACT|nr:MAG: hypothetical protein UX80_C0004G0006 [Candidatus Amesbacteria bacterium GW2011_GWA2_47_11b]KKU84769.1 MAG: hypothetical protein UY11_C0004G0011 [Candidatus Amesbacteria bacterium GW2011_GWC2_47_8]
MGILNSNITLSFVLITTISLLLAVLSKFYISASIGGLAFWFKRVHGFGGLFFNIGGLFSGELIPIIFLPRIFSTIADYLPFKYLAYFQVQLLLRQVDYKLIAIGVITQVLWLAFFVLISRIIWKAGLSQFEATGR